MRPLAPVLATLLICAPAARADEGLRLETADGHPMQYHLSLPAGWSRARAWPVLVVVEAAEKQFAENARRFVAARRDLPFIVVAPIVVTNGRAGQGDPAIYPYAKATWERIDREGVCAFDLEGLARVLDKVHRDYGGDEAVYLTGFEAGAHLVWAEVLLHPERLRAAAPVAGNYIGRCVDEKLISSAPARAALPVRGFVGETDAALGRSAALHGQFEAARKLAAAHGFAGIGETVVPGKGHVPMPDEVVAWFAELERARLAPRR